MKGMSTVLYQIPSGVSAFALVLVVMANRPKSRLRAALFLSAVGFGIWDLVQLHGVTGKFDAEFSWRWAPTPEEEYLRGLADRSESASGSRAPSDAADVNEQISRATSQWSDFRGPMRDGKQPGLRLKEDWVASPPKEIWKTPIGPGWSSFTVAGRKLFTQEQRGDNEAVVCLNAETGKVLWAHEYASRFWEAIAGAGPRATPTIGDDGIYSLGANGHVLCLDPITGKVRWTKDLQVDAGCKPPQWGFSASPLVQDGLVILHAGAATGDGAVVAYDAKTGDVRWKVSSGNHSYCSVHPAVFDHVSGILMSTNLGLQFLSVTDGSTIWNHEWPVENYRAIQPLVMGDSVLIGTSLGVGTRKIKVAHEGESWKISEAWTAKDMKPDFNDFVEYEGCVYGFDGNIFSCVDCATGKRKWKKGRYGNGQVLLLPDAGQLLVISETGELVLVKTDPDKHIELGKIQALTGKTWNHPVLIGNRLYLRNAEEAACYELAMESSP
jgi:outer membrane protein assembly factor BamB